MILMAGDRHRSVHTACVPSYITQAFRDHLKHFSSQTIMDRQSRLGVYMDDNPGRFSKLFSKALHSRE